VYQERASGLLTGMNSPHPFGAWVERTQRSVRRSSLPKNVTDDEVAVRRARRRSGVVPRQRRSD
jgi:hypothetical protein